MDWESPTGESIMKDSLYKGNYSRQALAIKLAAVIMIILAAAIAAFAFLRGN